MFNKNIPTNWWELRSWPSVRYYLLKSIGRTRFDDDLEHAWILDLVKHGSRFWRGMQSAAGRQITRKLVKRLCDNAVEREAFEAVWRLHGNSRATKNWLFAMLEGPKPPPKTREESLALAHEARRAKAAAKEAHARKMLAKHERALEREEQAVARWRRKVAAYGRRKLPTPTPPGAAPGAPQTAPDGPALRGRHPGAQNASQGPLRAWVQG